MKNETQHIIYRLLTEQITCGVEDIPIAREAHDLNDETLERIYIGRRFKKRHRPPGKTLRAVHQNDPLSAEC